VTRWSDAEIFWIIKNGIKDTGMSASGGSHGGEDIWALTALIRQLETITPQRYQAMTRLPAGRDKDEAQQPPRPQAERVQSQPAEPHKH
jgi:hypothetical protein